jgi:hypothetical protein
MTVRRRGFVFALSGVALTAAAVALVMSGLGGLVSRLGAILVVAPPAMITVGIAMMIAPGDNPSGLELADWLDSLPIGRRIGFYALGALGLALGGLLLLALGRWSVEGVLDLVL